MHVMEVKLKIITIIGLIMEGIAVITMAASSIFMLRINDIDAIRTAFEENMSHDEYTEMIQMMGWIGYFILGMAIFLGIFFIINVYIFPKLMMGKYTDEQAKKIYLYQAIWGGISLPFNQLTGILYLISGVQGHSGKTDNINVRDGL